MNFGSKRDVLSDAVSTARSTGQLIALGVLLALALSALALTISLRAAP